MRQARSGRQLSRTTRRLVRSRPRLFLSSIRGAQFLTVFVGWFFSNDTPLGAIEPVQFRFATNAYYARENGQVTLTVMKTGSGQGSVAFATRDASALAGRDYEPRLGTTAFAAGELSKTLPPVRTANNFIIDGERAFTLELTDPIGGALAEPAVAVIFILDDDDPDANGSYLQSKLPEPPYPDTNAVLILRVEPPGLPVQWRLQGDAAWRRADEPIRGLARGNYIVEHRPLTGYTVSPASPVAVQSGQTNVVDVYYAPAFAFGRGHLTVILTPLSLNGPADDPAHGGWRVAGESAWRAGGGTARDLPAGRYALEFKPVDGLASPLDQVAEVAPNQTMLMTCQYRIQPPPRAILPRPLTFEEVVSTNLPYLYVGQIKTDLGWGSGTVVRERVVLTVAHLLFDLPNLSYVTGAWWMRQKHRGHIEPVPQRPRGWYVFDGYAAQRELEALGLGQDDGVTSLELDVAALYFVGERLAEYLPGAGGYAGYLASNDGSIHPQLLNDSPKLLAGYPVSSIPDDKAGLMWACKPSFNLNDEVSGNLISIVSVSAVDGMLGGGVFAKMDQIWCYLGLTISSKKHVFLHILSSAVIDLIQRASISSYTESDLTGGGQILINVPLSSFGFSGGYISVDIAPESAIAAGAGWRLYGTENLDWYGEETKIPLILGVSFAIEFKPISGFDLPTNRVVEVMSGQVAILEALYRPKPPVMVLDRERGVGILGTPRMRYQLEFAEDLGSSAVWSPFLDVQSTNSTTWIQDLEIPFGETGYFRAVTTP